LTLRTIGMAGGQYTNSTDVVATMTIKEATDADMGHPPFGI
jgi:hypothetical protein